MGCARPSHRLGARTHRLDDLVVPGGACRGAAHAMASNGRPLPREMLRRVRLRAGRAASDHAVCGLPMRVPHSRCNDLPERALKSAAIAFSHARPAAGVDMFVKAGAELPALPPGPSGIRGRLAVARISPRHRPLSARRARATIPARRWAISTKGRQRQPTSFANARSPSVLAS